MIIEISDELKERILPYCNLKEERINEFVIKVIIEQLDVCDSNLMDQLADEYHEKRDKKKKTTSGK